VAAEACALVGESAPVEAEAPVEAPVEVEAAEVGGSRWPANERSRSCLRLIARSCVNRGYIVMRQV
jgi:hypothetical protein